MRSRAADMLCRRGGAVDEFADDARDSPDSELLQAEQDLADLLELGNGDFYHGSRKFAAALLDGFEGQLPEDVAIQRLARAAHQYGKRHTWDHKCHTPEGAHAWAVNSFAGAARLQQAERERVAEANGHDVAGALEPTDNRYQLIDDVELEQQAPVVWTVEGILPAGCLGALVGPADRFKSFAGGDFSASVQTGQLCFERFPTKQGQTVYILGEGRGRYGLRTKAWKAHRGIDGGIGIKFLPHPVQLMDPGETSKLLEAIERLPEPPALVVVDTVARCMVGGEENSAKDFGLFIAGADRIRLATGAAVLLIHHAGKDGKTRGSSALPGALDVHMLADADGDFVTITCDKMKDAERFQPIRLRRRVIQFEDGTSSLVLVPIDGEVQPKGVGDLPASVRTLVHALRSGPARAKELLTKSALADRTFYTAADKAKAWDLVTVVSGSYRLTAKGEALNA